MNFSRIFSIALIAAALTVSIAQAAFAAGGLGEPKNQAPFTNKPGGRAPALSGEAKNVPPFTDSVQVPRVVVHTGTGFDWASAGIGAACALGLGLAGAGTLILVRSSRRHAAAAHSAR